MVRPAFIITCSLPQDWCHRENAVCSWLPYSMAYSDRSWRYFRVPHAAVRKTVFFNELLIRYAERYPFERHPPITDDHQHVLQRFNVRKRVGWHNDHVSLIACRDPPRLIL